MKFEDEVFHNRSLGDPISFHELVWYPEVHTGPDHVRFKFKSLSYRHCFWSRSHAELCIELFSILDVSDLPETVKNATILISYFFDFKFDILILLDTFDIWWFFRDYQAIGLGETAISSDL